MAVVVVGWWCLRPRVLVRVVVGVVVRVVVVGMVMFMVMRVAMRSHVRAGGLTNMSALVGRVFAVLDLRRVSYMRPSGLPGHCGTKRSTPLDGSAVPTQRHLHLPLFHTTNADKVIDNTADLTSPAQRNALNAALEPTWSRCVRYSHGKHPALWRRQQCPSQHHRHTHREARPEQRFGPRKR